MGLKISVSVVEGEDDVFAGEFSIFEQLECVGDTLAIALLETIEDREDRLERAVHDSFVELVAEALAYNADLQAGAARVDQAVAALKIAGASLSPAVDILGRAAHKTSGGGGTDVTGVIISASWELDLWGRIRYGQQAARERATEQFSAEVVVPAIERIWEVNAPDSKRTTGWAAAGP